MPRVKQGDDAKLPLSSRGSPEFMALLQSAARQAGRSVSQEVEHRLLASFAAQTPSLTAEDVRQIVREEIDKGVLKLPSAEALRAAAAALKERTATSGAHTHGLMIAADQGQGPATCEPAPGMPSFAGLQAGQEPRRANLGPYYVGQGLWLRDDGSPVFPEDA